MEITERFINYTKFDTQSDDSSESVPSTPKQLVFAEYLKKEMEREFRASRSFHSLGVMLGNEWTVDGSRSSSGRSTRDIYGKATPVLESLNDVAK